MTGDSSFSEFPTIPVTSGSHPAEAGVPASHEGLPGAIGVYRVISRLGAGGFGEVFLAEQTHPVKRRVAIKVLRAGMMSPSLLARFEAERQMLVLMDHPGVAKVYDAGVTPDGRPYVAMEYVAGEPIHRFCENSRLSVDDRVRLMIRVCNAVHHAHMKGVIHRDLKPGNILVETVDGAPAPRVIDFGVAKAQDRVLSESAVVTELGQMVGTPEYMPPEQARGKGLGTADIDTRADVYSLGAVLYELLTGVTPLDSRDLRRAGYAELQRMIESVTPPLPSKRLTGIRAVSRAGDAAIAVPRVTRELDWIVMRCLEKDRARRYESAAALARDLERSLTDQPVEAGPPSLGYRASKFIARNRVAVAAAAACLIVGAAALVTTGWALSRAINDRRVAETEQTRALEARDEAEAVTAFLTGILESVQPDESGREVTVRRVLDDASRKLDTELHADGGGVSPLLWARLHVTLGSSYLALGELPDAEKHLTEGLRVREKLLGNDAPATLHARFNLAALHYEKGDFAAAKAAYVACLDAWRRSPTPPKAQIVGAMNNLAQIALKEGRLDLAESLQKQTITAMEEALGPMHEHTLGARINLGSMQRDQRRFAEAERTFTDVASAWRGVHGPDHPGTLLVQHNLVLLYLDMSRLDEAESTARALVEARTRVLGPDHPDTLGALTNLGLVLSRKGSPDAEKAYAEAWERAERKLGAEHPTTLSAGLNLMGIYENLGWPAAAHPRIERLVATLRRLSERPDAAAETLNSCAWLMLTAEPVSVRDNAAALAAATRACDLERRAGGASLWEYLDTLALASSRAGKHADAVNAQREAISLVPDRPEARQYLPEMRQRLAEYEQAASAAP